MADNNINIVFYCNLLNNVIAPEYIHQSGKKEIRLVVQAHNAAVGNSQHDEKHECLMGQHLKQKRKLQAQQSPQTVSKLLKMTNDGRNM
jgi:hypothetical protein